MPPPASLAPGSRRRLRLVAATAAALAAAASYVVATMRRPSEVSVDGVAVEEAVAREQARTCRPSLVIDGDPARSLRDARIALESARRLQPAAALRAELAVLRTAFEYPACRPTLFGLAYASAMLEMAEEAIRSTWTATELAAADRAAAAAELATIDAAEPAIERIIEAEADWALVELAPALRGEAVPGEAAVRVRDVLRTRALLRAACPAGTALAACADALADRAGLGSYTPVLRRYIAGLARLDALRADLR